MKTTKMTTIAAAGVFLAGLGMTALAANTGPDVDLQWRDNMQSTKTRAQVMAELEQARKQGKVFSGEAPYAQQGQDRTAAMQDRDDVRAEASSFVPRTNHDSFHHGS